VPSFVPIKAFSTISQVVSVHVFSSIKLLQEPNVLSGPCAPHTYTHTAGQCDLRSCEDKTIEGVEEGGWGAGGD
jgi:hypothetical protein